MNEAVRKILRICLQKFNSEKCIQHFVFDRRESSTNRGRHQLNKSAPTIEADLLSRASNGVFLGGSCNPTTWRQDIAMPFCEREGINYFNPQVDNWSKPLEKVEAYAKQEAGILLFVIDKETYALASMVEAAEYIGAGREVVLVMHEIQDAGAITNGRTGDREVRGHPSEKSALNDARESLRRMCIASGRNCTLFNQTYDPPVNDALNEALGHIKNEVKTRKPSFSDFDSIHQIEQIEELAHQKRRVRKPWDTTKPQDWDETQISFAVPTTQQQW